TTEAQRAQRTTRVHPQKVFLFFSVSLCFPLCLCGESHLEKRRFPVPTSTATAAWEGGLRAGRGHFNAASGAFGGDYSFRTRFEGTKGTNPEELIAAAHAACLSMALAAGLQAAKTPPTRISTTAACTIDKVGDG